MPMNRRLIGETRHSHVIQYYSATKVSTKELYQPMGNDFQNALEREKSKVQKIIYGRLSFMRKKRNYTVHVFTFLSRKCPFKFYPPSPSCPQVIAEHLVGAPQYSQQNSACSLVCIW